MKTLTLLSIAAIALLVGCSSQETAEKNELVFTKDLLFYKLDRDKLDWPGGYEPDDSDVPFTGIAIEYFEDTKKLKSKTPFKDGKPNGVETWWGNLAAKHWKGPGRMASRMELRLHGMKMERKLWKQHSRMAN